MSRYRYLSSGSSPEGRGDGTGFPFPYSAGDVTYLPSVTLPQLAKWWGRVKLWQVSTAWKYSVGATDYQWTNGTMIRTGFVPANEDELRAGGDASHQATGTVSGDLIFFPFLNLGTGKLLKSGSTFFPHVDISSSSLGTGADTCIFSFTDFAPSDGHFDVSIDGIVQRAYYQLAGLGTASPDTITLTPKEYWTYDGIYDATTGNVNPGHSPLE